MEVFDAISVSCVVAENQIIAYPNPSKGDFTLEISWNEETVNTQLQITDVTGKVIHLQNVKINEGVKQLYFNQIDLQSGTYLITFLNTELKPIRVVIH